MHQTKSKKILTYFFLFLIIGTLNNKNIHKFNLDTIIKIEVTGLDEQNSIELKNNLDFLKTNNLFIMNDTILKKIIDSNSLIEKYSVFKKYPSILDIKIYKTKFIAQVKKDDNIFFLGSNGKLIKTINLKKDIPIIYGNFEIHNFFELKKIMDEINYDYTHIKNFFYFQSGRWDIETNSGILIKLPNKNLKKSLELSVRIIEDDYQKKINKIDLRQTNQIIIND